MTTLSCDPTLRGQRSKYVIFLKFSKCFSSYRLNSRVTWLMHIDQLDTVYKSYGSKNSSGVIWGHRGQKVIFTKNAITPYRLHGMVMWFMHMHQLDTLYQSKGSKISSWVIWGHRGQKCEFLQLKRLNKKTNRFNYCVIVWTHSNKVLIVLWLIWYFIEIVHVKFLTVFYIVPSSSRSLRGHYGVINRL